MLGTTNNFIIQNVYEQVRFVNPFNPIYEAALHVAFESNNSPAELSKRHWEGFVGNNGYVYFADCEVTVRYCARRVSPRVWVDIAEGEDIRAIEAQQHLQLGWFYKPKATFNSRFDVDENFDYTKLQAYFENIVFNEPNIWNVFDHNGGIVSVLERDRETKSWKILANAGLDRKERRAYQYSLPIKSYRQFQYDMYRCGVELFWREGIAMNNPNINWEHRNDPKLSHILDIIDGGVAVAGRRDGVSTLRINDRLTLNINHKRQTVQFAGVSDFAQSEDFGKACYMMLAKSAMDLGREINHIRESMADGIPVEELSLINDMLFELQRRLTI